LEECLSNYKNFEGSDYDITKVLGLSAEFFEKQGQNATTKGGNDIELLPGVKERFPLQQDQMNAATIKPMIDMLKNYMK